MLSDFVMILVSGLEKSNWEKIKSKLQKDFKVVSLQKSKWEKMH